MIHDQSPSSVIQGILSNGEAGLMGSPAHVSGVVGIHWLHLISQANKAESHWDLSTSTNLMQRGSHCKGQGRTNSLCQKMLLLCALRCWRGEGLPQGILGILLETGSHECSDSTF